MESKIKNFDLFGNFKKLLEEVEHKDSYEDERTAHNLASRLEARSYLYG